MAKRPKRLKCPVCNEVQQNIEVLNTHLDIEHPIDAPVQAEEGPPMRDRSELFSKIRAKQLENKAMIRTRLEKRLLKLLTGIQVLTSGESVPTSAATGNSTMPSFWSWREVSATREFEQQVVHWENESVFERCRFCGQKFSFLLRKHHCRICGLVACGDSERECSLEVPARLLAQKLLSTGAEFPELRSVVTDYPLRLCIECRNTLFAVRNYHADCNSEPPRLLRLHSQLVRTQQQIDVLIPRFEDLLMALVEEPSTGVKGDTTRVRQARQELLALFSKYEFVARRIREAKVETETEHRLQAQIGAKATSYLQLTMLPLQALPQALRHHQAEVPNSAAASELQNQLVILEEQRFLLERQINEAKTNRHFDVLMPLEASLREITAECNNISQRLGVWGPST